MNEKCSQTVEQYSTNPLTANPEYSHFFFIFYNHIKYQLLSIIKIKRDINQQYLKIVDLHVVKSE